MVGQKRGWGTQGCQPFLPGAGVFALGTPCWWQSVQRTQ
jgi:hypothetical protein